MMHWTRHICAAAFAAGFLFATPLTQADNPLDKLKRGLANAAGGIVEMPATAWEDCREVNPPFGLTVGWLHGLGMFVARTMVGVYEIGTFPLPWPDNYKPYMTPRYAWDRFTEPQEKSPIPPPPSLAAPAPPAAQPSSK